VTDCPTGATNFTPEVVAYNPEDSFSPGGGFSNYFDRPLWQQAAVSSYLKKVGNRYDGFFNSAGRAYPDIAAQVSDIGWIAQRVDYVSTNIWPFTIQSVGIPIIWNGVVALEGGTSAAAPIAASVFALLNDALIAAGKPPMGFINPWLYKKGYRAFNDITSGYLHGYFTCGRRGFKATEGWDAASGYGTPVGLLTILVDLQWLNPASSAAILAAVGVWPEAGLHMPLD
jgi:tripeptidyl-peptidase-1